MFIRQVIKKDLEYFRGTIEDLYDSRELDQEELRRFKGIYQIAKGVL